MKWENRDIDVVEWANIPKFPRLLNGDFVLQLMECLTQSVKPQALVLKYLWIYGCYLVIKSENGSRDEVSR